jgi:4-amino-4-deoxy-L-arabinose transferase-like glycosyltransferase
MLRGRVGEPAWSRPALAAVSLLAAGLMLTGVNRSGYGNTYYASAALAASHSWSALLTNAADLGGYVSVDKGPLPDWMMGISGRLLGFGSWSVMLPNALCAVATVLVLHAALRRALGHEIAIVGALIMSLTPVAVLVGRFNTPDALLLLLLVCSAWALTVAVQSGRTRELLLAAVLLGLAFNTKMLEAYVALPALALAFALAAPGSPRRRLGQLSAAAGVALSVSFAWFGSMMLIPAADRPYVGDSTENSWFQLIAGANGVKRVTGGGGAFGTELTGRLLRLFSHHVGGQIAWLLPLALVGAVLGLAGSRRSRRSSPAFGAYVLWSVWGIVAYLLFSFSVGVFHAYYTSLLAPPVAALSAAALVTLWHAATRSLSGALALALAVTGTAILSFVLLSHAGTFVPWLRWVVLAAGAIAALTAIASHLSERPLQRSATAWLAVGAGTVAVIAGPAAYSIATVSRSHTGYDATAGPTVNEGAPAKAVARPDALSAQQSLALLIPYLSAHRQGARFVVAATDARTADPIALASQEPVITVGGFAGGDPTPTIAQLKQLVSSGQLRYVLLDATRGSPADPPRGTSTAPGWVKAHCPIVPYSAISGTAGSSRHGVRLTSPLTLFGCGRTSPRRSATTSKSVSVSGPNDVISATSTASRPRPTITRPMRGRLLRASNVYQWPSR